MDASNSKDAGDQKPKSLWSTILTTTPIALTVLATIFAGLSSSEMTQSMYYRSLASQHQAKVGDQWGFFQAKRIRGTDLEMTVQLLQSLAQPGEFDPALLGSVTAQILKVLEKAADNKNGESEPGRQAAATAAAKVKEIQGQLTEIQGNDKLSYLNRKKALPVVELRPLEKKEAGETLDAVLEAIGQRQSEASTAVLVAKLKPEDIQQAANLGEEDSERFDKECKAINAVFSQLRGLLENLAAAVQPLRDLSLDGSEHSSSLTHVPAQFDRLHNSFKAAALDFDARRYAQEAQYNRRVAEVSEVRVRRSDLSSDQHRERSKHFFYSMLLAQAGVTLSSLAMAGARPSWLWFIAAAAGLTAVIFTGYVYLML